MATRTTFAPNDSVHKQWRAGEALATLVTGGSSTGP